MTNGGGDEIKTLTDEVFRLQRELNQVNSRAAEKNINQLQDLMADHQKQIADLKAREARGEKGHSREIKELKEDIGKIKKNISDHNAAVKKAQKDLQRAADRLGKARARGDTGRRGGFLRP